MNHADADARLADIDVADLLVDQLFRDGLLRVALEFGRGNITAGTHDAGRLWIGRIDPDLLLRQRRSADQKTEERRKHQRSAFHVHLAVGAAWLPRTGRLAKFFGPRRKQG
jgi:hypothetical protein